MQLELKDVSYSYPQFSKKVELSLKNVNLTLNAFSMVSLVGSNGAGKTTLLNLIGGLAQPTGGNISREGEESVAFIPQIETEIGWMPITVAEILKMSSYGKRGYFKRLTPDDREKINMAAEQMSVTDLYGAQFNSLSRGERQRVRLALALAQEANFLIMDEPLNGLDIPSQDAILKAAQQEKLRGACVVIATHSLEEAALADEVVLLDGEVVAQGAPATTLTEENLRAVYKDSLKVLPDNKFIVSDHH